MSRVGLICLAALAAACGPKAAPALTPTLPGDGTAHVAPPVDPPPPVGPPDPWAGRTDLLVAPAPPPPSKLELPPVERFTLPNGLEVLVVASAELPTVTMQLAIRAGRDREPLARLGVAELTADLLVKGTSKRSALQIAEAVDFVGATLSADATFEATMVACSVLAKDLSTCLTLLPDVVMRPTFPEVELRRAQRQEIAGLRARFDNAGALAADHVQHLLWGDDHVRGWILDESDVAARTRDDLVAWHKAYYAPNNALLTVAGAVDVKALKASLTKAFGGWKQRDVAPAPRYADPAVSGIKVRLVDMPGQTQTQIRIGQLGLRHDDPRFFDALVWNYVLGGGAFSSRLMEVVRAEGGKTYGASSSFDRNAERGAFVAATFTRNAEAVATTKLVSAEITKMAATGPTATEVADAIANLAGSHAMRFESARDVANALLLAELHDFGIEYLENFGVRLAMVDAASAAAAAAELLRPRDQVIVLVGDARALEPQLSAAGWRYQKVSFAAPIGARPAPAAVGSGEPEGKRDAASVATAQRAVDAAIAAKGGLAALTGITSITLSATGTIDEAGQIIPVTMTRTVVLPDKNRVDIVLGGKVPISIGIDGRVGWQQTPKGIVDIPASEIALLDLERWREPELVLLRGRDPGASLALLPSEKIDGRTHTKVRINGADGRWVVLWLDDQSHLLSRLTYDDESGAAAVDDFRDYRPEAGIQVARTRVQRGAGRVTTFSIGGVLFNTTVEPSTFARPK
ncbi:MAG: pitrilysin family protein [Kofleriaceae bacterium]